MATGSAILRREEPSPSLEACVPPHRSARQDARRLLHVWRRTFANGGKGSGPSRSVRRLRSPLRQEGGRAAGPLGALHWPAGEAVAACPD